jgi:pyruvate formate lyase activating enzyme
MHRCSLNPGQQGICLARKNVEGKIICDNYGMATSLALDPIEKKPLKMYRPGSLILSVGSFGCNLKCPFCQNHEISMIDKKTARETIGSIYISPEELTDRALECRKEGNIGVAFTYNEPLVGWEYVRDAARLVKEAGMDNVLVTNGSVSLEVLEQVLPYIDAMNIDLKGFREAYYRKLGGDFETVKAFIARAAGSCHVELTTLIVPGENDGPKEMEEEAEWIASINREIPLHVSRFFPQYRMKDRGATERKAVYALADIARKHLENVFVGNC